MIIPGALIKWNISQITEIIQPQQRNHPTMSAILFWPCPDYPWCNQECKLVYCFQCISVNPLRSHDLSINALLPQTCLLSFAFVDACHQNIYPIFKPSNFFSALKHPVVWDMMWATSPKIYVHRKDCYCYIVYDGAREENNPLLLSCKFICLLITLLIHIWIQWCPCSTSTLQAW